jgi:hypothetical protein
MENLYKTSTNLIQIVEQALDWTNHHSDELSKAGIREVIKSARRILKKVQRTTNKRPGVAIFGQSQVGKSYLVKSLTKAQSSQNLGIQLPGKEEAVDFIKYINPTGDGKESTGVVTRFTTHASHGTTPEFPVKVELFSQLEIAAILVNSFWSDLKEFPTSERNSDLQIQIIDLFKNLSKNNSPSGSLDEDEVFEFVAYIKAYLGDSYHIRELDQAGYFTKMIESLHLIPFEKRVQVLEWLWLHDPFMTQLFTLLSEIIQELDEQKIMFVSPEAIFPNKQNVLDIQRVREIFIENTPDRSIRVKSSIGKIYSVPISSFSCITREVELQVSGDFKNDQERSFMLTTDVLDFPGSKTRELIPYSVFRANNPIEQLQLFIRGKVSFLFDSYTSNDEVCSLLYCYAENPPEDKGIRLRLHKWIQQNLGGSPEMRKNRLNEIKALLKTEGISCETVSPLMVVMTKFNVEMSKFDERPDISIHDSKWQARLGENFSKFMNAAVEDKWTTDWDAQDSGFKFVFPIRDPQFSHSFFEGWDTKGSETHLRPAWIPFFEVMGQSFKSSDLVRLHIPEPTDVWSELIQPNGTGIASLSKYLNPASNPIVTYTKLASEIEKSRSALRKLLGPYLLSGNLDSDLQNALKIAGQSHLGVMGFASQKPSQLGKLFRALSIQDAEIWSLLWEFKFSDNPIEAHKFNSDDQDYSSILSDIGIEWKPGMSSDQVLYQLKDQYPGMSPNEIKSNVKEVFGIDLEFLPSVLSADVSENSFEFTSIVINYWQQKLLTQLENSEFFHGVRPAQKEAFVTAIQEIVKTKNLFKLSQLLKTKIGLDARGVMNKEDFEVISSCCSAILNNYLFTAGWVALNEEDRPLLPKESRPLFSSLSKSVTRKDLLNYSTKVRKKHFMEEWAWGTKELFSANIRHQYGVTSTVDSVGNAKLALVLEKLTPTT